LADYLERDDSPRVRAAVETHAASCADCGALLADLQQLRVDASGLPTLSPSRDLWAGIAERIETPVIELGARGAGRGAREAGPLSVVRRARWMRPVAAAAALVVMTAGVTYFVTREAVLRETQVAEQADRPPVDPLAFVRDANDSARRAEGMEPRVAARPENLGPRTSDLGPRIDRAPAADSRAPAGYPPQAGGADRGPASLASNQTPALTPPAAAVEDIYGREIARLRRIIDQRRATLDTATVGVIERNLGIIDMAIRESRAALARDPASALLNEQLAKALEQKVELLRAAVLLPVRS
jgi:hypothetical protein